MSCNAKEEYEACSAKITHIEPGLIMFSNQLRCSKAWAKKNEHRARMYYNFRTGKYPIDVIELFDFPQNP